MKTKKYAITLKHQGMENPQFRFDTAEEVSEYWLKNIHGTATLDYIIHDNENNFYEAGFDGGYFLNKK